MLAFHSDPAIKAKYMDRVKAHRAADEILQRYAYWKDGKGCAVGCTIHSSEHDRYETELGIPEGLALLEDSLFESMSVESARTWPERFLQAIPVGADLSQVGNKLMLYLLQDYGLKAATEDGQDMLERVTKGFEQLLVTNDEDPMYNLHIGARRFYLGLVLGEPDERLSAVLNAATNFMYDDAVSSATNMKLAEGVEDPAAVAPIAAKLLELLAQAPVHGS